MGTNESRREASATLSKQKNTLDLFLERNAISKEQYDKSLGDLIEKMGMKMLENNRGKGKE